MQEALDLMPDNPNEPIKIPPPPSNENPAF